MMESAEYQMIDIDRVLAEKNPRLKRLLPRFLLRLIKRILHQDEINDFIMRHRHLEGLPFVRAVLSDFQVTIRVVGQENLPEGGRFVVAANHPLGGLDGLALMQAVGDYRPDLVFPVNDLLLNIPNLRPLFLPVNKHGRNINLSKMLDDTFSGSKALLYFPAGLCSRRQEGQVLDLEWKKTFVTKARQYQRDVVPVHIDGANRSFFYNLARFRVKLGIKANIEMFFLPDEMFRQKGKVITITFGKPVKWSSFTASRTDQQWAALLRELVYRLHNDADATLDTLLK
ncbi:MAG: 1-acyl-sn-glycerol-3-phosphate acyltransferase [Bacteroidales bacterium]|nr:1-acyl-sn-glycerol-3-phosphate acyltransferase [Bacteroidales bacterium]MDD3665887.1 1-acyl-sn-glycerol-3-phosphate acyltransferase [Bacteroidales bacterium]